MLLSLQPIIESQEGLKFAFISHTGKKIGKPLAGKPGKGKAGFSFNIMVLLEKMNC
jgi:hypothetical protein